MALGKLQVYGIETFEPVIKRKAFREDTANLAIYRRGGSVFIMKLYTKLGFRDCCRRDFRACVLTGYPRRFEPGNGAVPVDQHVTSVFAPQRYQLHFVAR